MPVSTSTVGLRFQFFQLMKGKRYGKIAQVPGQMLDDVYSKPSSLYHAVFSLISIISIFIALEYAFNPMGVDNQDGFHEKYVSTLTGHLCKVDPFMTTTVFL